MSALAPPAAPKVERCGDVTVLTFSADVVRDAEDVLGRELVGIRIGVGEHLLLDFTNVGYLNGAELGTLVALHVRLRAAGGRMTLFHLRPLIRRVFTTCRLETLLKICEEGRGPGWARRPTEIASPTVVRWANEL